MTRIQEGFLRMRAMEKEVQGKRKDEEQVVGQHVSKYQRDEIIGEEMYDRAS